MRYMLTLLEKSRQFSAEDIDFLQAAPLRGQPCRLWGQHATTELAYNGSINARAAGQLMPAEVL